MLRVFTGEDTFRARSAYRVALEDARTCGLVLTIRDAALAVERLAAAIREQPLFGVPPVVAAEELTVFTGKDGERVIEILGSAPSDRLLLLWEQKPPERSKVWQWLRKHADHVAVFPLLSSAECAQWVLEIVRARGGTMERATTHELIRVCGSDTWTLSNEIDKLLLYSARAPGVSPGTLDATRRAITAEDIADVSVPVTAVNVFATVRALATGDARAALAHLARHRRAGDDSRMVLSMTIREVRLLLLLRDRLDRQRQVSPFDVAREHRLPTSVASALLQAAQRLSAKNLRSFFDRLLFALYALNTGRAEADDVLDSIAFQTATLSR